MSEGLDPRLPVRILHVDLHRGWGGGQTQLLILARQLAVRGFDQRIAALEGSPLAERAAAAGFDVAPLHRRGETDPRAILALRDLSRRFRADVVHAHDPHGLALAAVAARLLRPRPAVVGHRRVDYPIRSHAFSRWKYASGADRLIAVSRHARDVLGTGGVPPERIAVIPDAADPDPPPFAQGPSLRARIGAPPEALLVTTIASTAERKDHPTILRASARLRPRVPSTRWVVMGGEGPALEALREAARAAGVGSRLHYLGFLPDARARLDESDVFALTSRSEALGSAILEAMAAGVAVVATRAGGIPEVVEHERTGLLTPVADPAAVAAAIDRLLDDRALATRLAIEARKRLPAYDAANAAERVAEVYRVARNAS